MGQPPTSSIMQILDVCNGMSVEQDLPDGMRSDLLEFVRTALPLLDETHSIAQTGARQMPLISTQLERAASTTEEAAERILDLIDGVVKELSLTQGEVNASDGPSSFGDQLSDEHVETLHSLLADDHPEIWLQLLRHQEREEQKMHDLQQRIASAIKSFEHTRRTMNQIVESLQVQDVVRQQLTAVDSQIDRLRTRLDSLAEELEGLVADQSSSEDPDGEVEEEGLESGENFDANARLDFSGEAQLAIDDVINQFKQS